MPTKEQISEVMSALGKRNKGKRKRRTIAGDVQRINAARKSAAKRRGKPRPPRKTATAGDDTTPLRGTLYVPATPPLFPKVTLVTVSDTPLAQSESPKNFAKPLAQSSPLLTRGNPIPS